MTTSRVTRGDTTTSSDLEIVVRPKSKDGKLSKSERTRRRILEAAEDVFGRLGYYETSIVEITQQAGVAQGTFYLYFPSKIEIFRQLLLARGREMREHLAAAVEGVTDRRVAERAGLRAYFDWVAAHPHAYRVARQADFVEPEIMKEWFTAFADAYAAGLGKSMRAGDVRETDPQVLAWAVMGMADFTALRFVIWNEAEPLSDDKLDALVEAVLRALGIG